MKLLVVAAVLALTFPSKAEVTPQKTPVTSAIAPPNATQKKSDRVLILEKELSDTKEKITTEKARNPINLAQVNRLYGDSVALERELAAAVKEPVYDSKTRPQAPSKVEDTAIAKAVAVTASEPVPATHEAWDIFKNFGRK